MLSRMRRRTACSLLLVVISVASRVEGRVTRIEVQSREDVLGGKAFGNTGAYERIAGRVYFSVVVADDCNRRIVDLERAANLRNGKVEFSADFFAIRPKDPRKGNGSLLLSIPNRGNAWIISTVDGGDWDVRRSAGDGWLLRNGYTVVGLGWQWDAVGADALRLYAPIARENGHSITGLLRGDLMLSHAAAEIPLGHLIVGKMGSSEYPVSAPEDSRNLLTVRDSPEAKRVVIPRSEWRFAQVVVGGKLAASDRHIYLEGGFKPGKIYEYVYVVKDPVIAGLGFAAVRDFAAYCKHNTRAAITPAARVYGEGISQNGRFLRDFLYQGFNADEAGNMALDGVLAHVAGAGRGSFNYRFAQPSRDAQPTSSLFFPTDIFPFTDQPERDAVTGETDGLLKRATAARVVPKIFFSNTSYEYWGRVASLTHTSIDGKRDVALSPAVRIYHFTGLQHFSGPFPPAKGTADLEGQAPESPLPIKYFWRSMIANMDGWVRQGTPPPASNYPRVDDGTLVPLDKYKFPVLPGVNRAQDASKAYRIDFGVGWRQGVLSLEPPKVGEAFPALVPQVDADGNERDGVRLPEIRVPLATYAPWNLRDPSIGAATQRVSFEGSYLPFPKTPGERKRTGDPRRSISERYASREEYLHLYGQAIGELVGQRWILGEDRDALMERGKEEWNEATK